MSNRLTPTSASTGSIRKRLWVEVVVGSVFIVAFVTTLFDARWIEDVFGADPDAGNGAIEWLLVGGFAVGAVFGLGLASFEWRSTRNRRAHSLR